jgi:RNA 3'-terminal phosphate cyclase (ATP)
MIHLDGAYGEGGGQLVRTAVALSALTGTPLRIANVRGRRARPGLAAQHVAAVRAVGALCEARCEGVEPRATAFSFEPRARPAGGELRVDVGTAGSVTLVLQALLPILIRARHASRVVVTGGTDVRQAPTWDYFQHVLLPLLARMDVHVRAMAVRRGYYPGGGGEVAVETRPGTPRALLLESNERDWRIAGKAHVSQLPRSVAERMRDAAVGALARDADLRAQVVAPEAAAGTGGAITLWAESGQGLLGASRAAQRGVRAETLGHEAGSELAADLAAGAALDVHAADQVLVYLALATGASAFTVRAVSSHARTAMWLIPQFVAARFDIAPAGRLSRITVTPGG